MADLIYIGVLAPMDTFENNNTNENPSAVQGTYDETVMQGVSVQMSDNFDPGTTYNDDFNKTPDTFTYDLGSGPITSGLDGEARFAAEVIRAGSTTPESIEISVYQLQNGATFVRLPDGYKINQLTIQSMVSDGYDGIFTNSSSSSTVVCFTAGTWIDTPDGPNRIENLRTGDLVMTVDRGGQPIVWMSRWQVRTQENTTSVRFEIGSLGGGVPFAPLEVSRQHRLFVTSPVASRMFDAPGALIAAHRLVGMPGIAFAPIGKETAYLHIACRNHELVRANGVCAETLLNAPMTRQVLGFDPDECAGTQFGSDPVRPLITPRKQRRYVERITARAIRKGHIGLSDIHKCRANAAPPAFRQGMADSTHHGP